MSALSPFRAILCGVFVATLMPCACGMAQTASGEERHATSRHVVIISVDGLKPEFLFRHDLKLPAMRGLMKQGTYARGVVGVTPTVTFPSHTTIISGVTPSRHGICSNAHPDNDGHLVSYARYSEIKSPTILDAVHGTGLTTAAIGWPVTVDAPVDYLITPQAPDGASPLARQISFPDSLRAVDDDARSIWASLIIKRYNPNLMLLHFNDLDRMEHKYGPDSDEAAQTAQRIDARIDAVIVMEKALNPDATIIVVSDHGFAPLRHDVALSVPLREALDANGTSEAGSDKRAGRRFLVWSTDGSAYVLVPDARDRPFIQTELQRLKNRDDMGIDRILSETELAQAGGCPDAAFMVGMKLGWGVSGAVDGPAVRDIAHGGTHGYLPDQPSMRSTFIMTGPDIAHDHDIGIIDMRQIAPTILHILGVAPEPGMVSALGVSGHVRAARSSADAR